MHIPDGYLSPSTCAAFYALVVPSWHTALSRIKRVIATRTVPLIAVFAAFSFVLMMFNIPLPGGTTGHAVGVAIATIVLGPWGSILAISITLAIQALFFGDGGITTLGANCFLIAVVGSLVAHAVYRLVAGQTDSGSRRRVVAAALAGYSSVNASAFLTAVALGIQPMLFHDVIGTPLYAPYPLHIAIPAMMLGHVTIAGLAEAIVSAGMVSYLQRTDPGLLRGLRSQNLSPMTSALPMNATPCMQPSSVRLWLVVGAFMMCTPLGILAAGTAWGEWSSSDWNNTQVLAEIASVSGNNAPPVTVPSGLSRLSDLWTAPFPDYAPGFVRSEMLGYLLSAMFGVGLLVVTSLVLLVFRKRAHPEPAHLDMGR